MKDKDKQVTILFKIFKKVLQQCIAELKRIIKKYYSITQLLLYNRVWISRLKDLDAVGITQIDIMDRRTPSGT